MVRIIMACVYDVICPKCGHPFQIVKGAFVMELVSGKKLPKSRDEDEPDYCPKCKCRISVNDSDFRNHVKQVMMAD